MTITYHAGNRIQALSTDVVETLSFSENFDSNTGFTQTGTLVTVNSGVAGKLSFDAATAGSDRRVHKSLGLTLSDSAWVARFEYKYTASNVPAHMIMSFQSGTGDTFNATLDGLGIVHGADYTGNELLPFSSDGSTKSTSTSYVALTSNTQYYVEVARTSTTNVRLKVFSDSGFSTQVGSTVNFTVPSTTTTLTYMNSCVNSAGNSIRSLTSTIDNLKIYDGVTSLTSKPTNVPTNSRFEETDTRKIYYLSPNTFTTDFSSSTGWTQVGTGMSVNNNRADAVSLDLTTANRIWYDLGRTISDTAFRLDFTFYISSMAASRQSALVWLGSTNGLINSNDGINAFWRATYNNIELSYTDNGTTNQNMGYAGVSTSTGVTYYVTVIRNGSNYSLSVYSNSARTTQVGSTLTASCPSTVTGLRYIAIGSYQGGNAGETTTYWVDDITLVSGSTSLSTTENYWSQVN